MYKPETLYISSSVKCIIKKIDDKATLLSEEYFSYEIYNNSIKFFGIPQCTINGQTFMGNINIINGVINHMPFEGPKVKEYHFILGNIKNINVSSSASIEIDDNICNLIECNIYVVSAGSFKYNNIYTEKLNLKCSSASDANFKNGRIGMLDINSSSASNCQFSNINFKNINAHSSSASRIEFDKCTTIDITKESKISSTINTNGLIIVGREYENSKSLNNKFVGNSVSINNSNIGNNNNMGNNFVVIGNNIKFSNIGTNIGTNNANYRNGSQFF